MQPFPFGCGVWVFVIVGGAVDFGPSPVIGSASFRPLLIQTKN